MAYDSATGKTVLFGGYSGSSYLSDTWIYGSVSSVINVSVTGSQTYGGSASLSQTNQAPQSVTVSGTLNCTTVDSGTSITSRLQAGSHTVDGSSCSGLSSSNPSYSIAYTGATNGYVVSKATQTVSNANLPASGYFGGGFHRHRLDHRGRHHLGHLLDPVGVHRLGPDGDLHRGGHLHPGRPRGRRDQLHRGPTARPRASSSWASPSPRRLFQTPRRGSHTAQ